MRTQKLAAAAALAVALTLGLTLPSAADAVIKVSLWDKADMMGKMDFGKSMGMGMGPDVVDCIRIKQAPAKAAP